MSAFNSGNSFSPPVVRRIKASAGSGKTYDLTRRFLEFLSRSEIGEHDPLGFLNGREGWGDILAVTFTNAAAAEMRVRIVRALKEAALGITRDGPLPAGRAAMWVDVILRQYGALNVRTIDSLLQHVARSAAAGLGLSPDFEISFRMDDIFSPLADELMERARVEGDTLYNLVYNACWSLVRHERLAGFMAGGIMEERLFPLLPMVLGGEAKGLAPASEVGGRLRTLRRKVEDAAAGMIGVLRASGAKAKAGMEDALERAARGDEDAFKSAWLKKDSLEDCLLKASLKNAPERAFEVYAGLSEAATRWCDEGAVLRRALALAPFMELAVALGKRGAEFQAREGVVPGFAVTGMALRALSGEYGASQAVYRLGSGLRHLFIDEFQDTSREQWEALKPLAAEALARGGSLTLVGDVKQAIYGWRGGDAELFDSVIAEREILAMEPEIAADALPTNWRSRANVVKFNNRVFSGLGDVNTALAAMEAMMPKNTPPRLLGESAGLLAMAFQGAAQTLPGGGRAAGGHVSIREIEAENAAELGEAGMEAVLKLLREVAARRPYGDVAILVRGNKDASKLAARIMAEDIPVMTENSLVLDEHPLIQELLAFLTFLDSPDDDLAFWTVIDGHILAGSDFPDREDLLELAVDRDMAAARGKPDERGKSSLYEAFQREYGELWADLFEPLLNQSGLMAAYDLVREIYRRFEIMRRFARDAIFLQRFLEIVHLAEGRGVATLPAFLEAWKSAGVEEKAPMPKVLDAVRVMTIHKAKGLEFPVVIIPSLALSRNGDSAPRICEVGGLKVAAYGCKEMGDDYIREQAARLRESMHLCYVAFTRAVHELHVLHTVTARLRSRPGLVPAMDLLFAGAGLDMPLELGEPPAGGLAGASGEAGKGGDPAESPEEGASGKVGENERTGGAAGGVSYNLCPEGWRPMDWLPRLKIFRNPMDERDSAAARGELAHACLAQLALNPGLEAEAVVAMALRSWPYGASEAMKEEMPGLVRMVGNFPGFADILPGCLVEQPVFDAEGRMFRMDLVAVRQGRPWLIVDYKTGQPEEKNVEQVRNYIKLLENIDRVGPEIKAALLYVDLGFCRIVDKDGVRDSERLF